MIQRKVNRFVEVQHLMIKHFSGGPRPRIFSDWKRLRLTESRNLFIPGDSEGQKHLIQRIYKGVNLVLQVID